MSERWQTVAGSIERSTDESGKRWTHIRLAVTNRDGISCGQRLDIETSRLERVKGLLGRVLDQMVRDLGRWDALV